MRAPRPAGALLALLLVGSGPRVATAAAVVVPLPPLPPLPPAAPHAQAAPTLPPYENDLERLAELMGTLAFMRELCGSSAGADWREKMTALLATEGVTDERRARLAGRFNRGYEGYRMTYRRCTPASETIIARSLAEGERLSSTLSRHFGAE